MKKYLITLCVSLTLFSGFAQSTNDFTAFFEEAYEQFPSIPRGMLESLAWTRSRMTHLTPKSASHNCLETLPQYYGVMGLVDGDAEGYFNNSLKVVAQLTQYSEQEIKQDPRKNILAFAEAFTKIKANQRVIRNDAGSQKDVIAALSEIPQNNDIRDQYALDQEFYSVLKRMADPAFRSTHRMATREVYDWDAIFGKENYTVLSASYVELSQNKISNRTGQDYVGYPATTGTNERSTETSRAPACSQSSRYGGAIWDKAHERNYGSRGSAKVEFITIHTIQGSYASAISWFKNRNARVSAHYVIRAFDGQVTQMVCEDDKGFHVKQYNSKAIGIEHEGYIDDGPMWYTTAMYESSATLVRDLCKRYNIDPKLTYAGPSTRGVKHLGDVCTKIKGHQHFKGNDHIDPGPFWDWARFYRLINGDPEPTVLDNKKGTFTDAGGEESNYGDLARKAYLIKPKNATLVELTFEAFETEENYDYLEIFDGENPDGVFLGRFSGKKLPPTIQAKSGAMYLRFWSDCQFNKKGWKANYSSKNKKEDCPKVENLKVRDIFPLGVTLIWDKEKKASHYQIYLNRTNIPHANWSLYRTRQNGLTVTGLGADAPYQWQIEAVCEDDTSARTGSNFMTPPISKKADPKAYTVRRSSGRLYDSGGREGVYSDGEDYVFTIQPPDNKRVILTFTEFETEADLDVLTIYDGLSPSAPLLQKLSGNTMPNVIQSSGNGLTLHFTSDRRTTAKGWAASWTSTGGGGNSDNGDIGSVDPGNTGNNGNSGNTSGNNSSSGSAIDEPFVPNTQFSAVSPRTKPLLQDTYNGPFTLSFDDKDRSGRGLANRFFSVMKTTSDGWRGDGNKGFFYDDFEGTSLHSDWKSVTGNWKVQNNRLIQLDASLQNTNVYAKVKQEGDRTYIYRWLGRLSGTSKNQRFGFHFFCSNAEKENRDDSYFIWVRKASTGDQIEIYEVVNDKFRIKSKAKVSLGDGKVHDYKVIYNPRKGRMEVYLDNKFVVSWVDPSPLTTGKAVSFRTGASVAEYDDFQIFHNRRSSIKLSIGKGAQNDIDVRGISADQEAFRISSLVVDRTITWSPISTDGAKVDLTSSGGVVDTGNGGNSGNSSSSNTGNSSNTNTGNSSGNSGSSTTGPSPSENKPVTNPAPTGVSRGDAVKPKPTLDGPASKSVWLGDSYTDDFTIDLSKRAEIDKQFYLPVEQRGGHWTARSTQGFMYDAFPRMGGWKSEVGKWEVSNQGHLRQSDAQATNGNTYHSLKQDGTTSYLYNWKARILSKSDNTRFGLHFFCSDPTATNRGNSYMVWFRNHTNGADKVEIYRSVNNKLQLKRKSTIDIKEDQWYDIKLHYDAVYGDIEIYLNNELVLKWKDPGVPLKMGSYVSFRTGSSLVLFDDLKVYKLYEGPTPIRVGDASSDMIGTKRKARIYTIERERDGDWYKESHRQTTIK